MTGEAAHRRLSSALSAAAVAALLAFGAWLTIPTPASAVEAQPGTYIIVAGPYAGTTVSYSGSEAHGPAGLTLKGRVVDAEDTCPYPHFRGAIDGHAAPRKSPCWRVVPKGQASRLLDEMAAAVGKEYAAIQLLSKGDVAKARAALAKAHTALSGAYDQLAANSSSLSEGIATKLDNLVVKAEQDDRAASKDLPEHLSVPDEKAAASSLAAALKVKSQFLDELPPWLLVGTVPATTPPATTPGTTPGATTPHSTP